MAKQAKNGGDESTALARLVSAYPALGGGGAVAEALQANLGGEDVGMFDLVRVKMPSGGMIAFELPSSEGGGEPDYVKELEGIIVYHKIGRSYWQKSIDDGGGGSPPDCSSPDGIHGFGDPGGLCASCPLSEFGSAPPGKDGSESRGQACKQLRFVFLLRQGEALPTLLTLPPTSLKPMKRWLLSITQKGRPYWSLLVRFQLRKAKNKGGIEYAEVVPSVVRELSQEEVDAVYNYAKTTKETFAQFREGIGAGPEEDGNEEELQAFGDEPTAEVRA